jgi:phage-related protein
MPVLAYWQGMGADLTPKPLVWIAGSLDDLKEFPPEVRSSMGYALYVAQCSRKHARARPLKGFGGAGVLEVVQNFDGNAYRAVYTVRFAERVYVLHAFQKKSKRGIATPRAEIDLVKARLGRAEAVHAEWLAMQRGDR